MNKNVELRLDILKILVISLLPFQVLMYFEKYFKSSFSTVLIYLLGIFFIFLSIKIVGKPKEFNLKIGNNWNILKKLWYFYIVVIIFVIFNFLGINLDNSPNLKIIFFFLIETFLGVIYEEFLFRGLILGKLVEYYRLKNKDIWSAILISSFIFSIMHILNLISKPYYVVGTSTQIIYTFFLGVLLGTVYFISNNIWVPILLHSLFNLAGSYVLLFADNNVSNIADMPIFIAVIEILLILPVIFLSLNLYKNNNKNLHGKF